MDVCYPPMLVRPNGVDIDIRANAGELSSIIILGSPTWKMDLIGIKCKIGWCTCEI